MREHTSNRINMLEWSAKKLFNTQAHGYEGFDVTIDGKTYRVIIQQHTSPMNEQKEDRLLLILDNVLHRGSYVKIGNENWLVMTDVDFNGIYYSCKIQKTNNVLTFINSTQTPTTISCIISNLTLYSDGLSTDKVMTMPDGKRSVVVSKTEETSKFKVGQRFIFNNSDTSIFSISHIDDFSMVGLIILTMIQEQKQDGDNLELNIAENNQGQVNKLWHF